MVQAQARLRHAEGVPLVVWRDQMAGLLQRLSERQDVEAFRALYEAYGPRVKAYMLRLGTDAATAEDLAQETLLTVWRKASLYSEAKGNAATWIFAIARNLRIDRLRRELPLQELPETFEERPSEEPRPDERAIGAEVEARMRSIVSSLPPEQHEVVMLSYIEGLSHAEIAARLALPLGTIKSRMRLAYQKLRAAVEDLK